MQRSDPRYSHNFFALVMVGIGIWGLIQGDFTATWAGVPEGFPGREALAYLTAAISLVSGIGLLWRRTASLASRLLLGSFAVWLLLVRVPPMFGASAGTGDWWGLAYTAEMTGAAWVLYTWSAGERDRTRRPFATGDKGLRIARILYGFALIPYGIAHFTYLDRTVSMVPPWLPWHLAFACLTGAAFIAAGVAVIIGVLGRLAASLSALQMGLFTLLVWGPVIAAGPDAAQWSELISSFVVSAAAWVVADSYRGLPWRRATRR